MSLLILVSAFLLLLTVAWSLYAEFFGLRPWRELPGPVSATVYSHYLQKQITPAQERRAGVLRHTRLPEAEGRRAGRGQRRAARRTARFRRKSICSIASAPR